MRTLESLLAATDFSADANLAVRRAALLAHRHGATLHVLHVVNAGGGTALRAPFAPVRDTEREAARARETLQRLADEITRRFDVSPTVEVAVGDPFQTLLLASQRAGLVVVGRRGHTRLRGLLMGRTAERLLRVSGRPVLVVRTPVDGPYRRVLVPTDLGAASDAAVRLADRMRGEAGLRIVHALDPRHHAVLREVEVPEHLIRAMRLKAEAEVRARLQRRVAALGVASPSLSLDLAQGPAGASIPRHALRHRSDLIVAAKQGRSTLAGFLLGSVSRRLLADTACDVLLVPRPREDPRLDAVDTVAADGPEEGLPAPAPAPARAPQPDPWIHRTARFTPTRTP